MSGETNLTTLLRSMTARLDDATYGFVTLPCGPIPDGLHPCMTFQETEGTTLIARLSDITALGLPYEFPCRKITLTVHSALDAVGFLAVITTELAKCGMGVNPVSAFYHDHLFVPAGREHDALRALSDLAATA